MLVSCLRGALGAAALCAAANAMAAGPLDGIYQVGTGEEWFSVHQEGNHVIVGRFFNGAGNFSVPLANGQLYTANKGGRWYLMAGDLAPGSTLLTFTGESSLGACLSTYRIDFGVTPMVVEWVSDITSNAGQSQGIDCPAAYQASTVSGRFRSVKKIY